MQVFEKIQEVRLGLPRFSLSGDVNGLVLVIGVLVTLMALTGPSEAQCLALWDWISVSK